MHKATLDGKTWAVKVQRPAIQKQMVLCVAVLDLRRAYDLSDLWGYRTLLKMFEWTFDMPISFIGPYVSSEISKEVDFRHEAENSERTRDLIAAEPSLAGRVITPCVAHILTMSDA